MVAKEIQADDQRLTAYVVYDDGEELTASEVRRHLRRHLPEYMIPSVVVAIHSSISVDTPNGTDAISTARLFLGSLPEYHAPSSRSP